MRKKTTIIITTIIVVVAAIVFIGLMLVGKGEGPVMSMVLSDKAIESIQSLTAAKSSPDSGTYLILENEFNKYEEKYKTVIPAGKNLYASIHFVEVLKGTKFTARWIAAGKTVKEEIKEMLTNQEGVLSFLLEGNNVKSGSYTLELYGVDKKILEYEFSID
jgi:hypothetical protein